MIPKIIGSYGGPYADAEVVEDPTTQIASSLFNQAIEDLAQATRSVARALVAFDTDPAALPGDSIPVVDATSVWGDSASANPTITKLAAGVYEVAWAVSYVDGLGNSESVSLRFAGSDLGIGGSPYGFTRTELTGANSLAVNLGDLGGLDSDLGGKRVTVWAR